MTSKAAKLMFARERIVSDLKHAVTSMKTFNKDTSHLLIACKIRALDTHWNSFQDNLAEIESTVSTVENKEEFFALNQSMQDEHMKTKIKIAELLKETEDAEVSLDSSFFQGTHVPKPVATKVNYSARLPEIKLNKFSGQYDEWTNFSQLFLKLMSREGLDTVDKMYYLNQSLQGEPLQLIKHLPVDENSFDSAWDLLKSQYEMRRHIVHAQFQLFFSIKRINKDNIDDLRTMLRIILECESAFKSLKLDADSLGSMMVYYCSRQFDTDTAKEWEMELRDEKNEPKLSRLISFLQTRCRLLTQIEKYKYTTPSTSKPKGENTKNQKSAKTFLIQEKTTKTFNCTICHEGHRPFECPKITQASVQDRRTIIKESQLCFNCFYNHHSKDCTSKYTCTHCKARHHTLLHIHQEPKKTEFPKTETPQFTGFIRENRETLLATALIPVFHENGKKSFVRALIDQGSTSNFVTENLCQIMSAQKHKLNTTITSLNETQTGKISAFTNITIGSLYDENYRFTFEALVLKKITNIDGNSCNDSNYLQHLHGLELADPNYYEKGKIDILIGARVYAEIILPGLRNRQNWVGSCQVQSRQAVTTEMCHAILRYSRKMFYRNNCNNFSNWKK